jgi:hypothetical protein
MNMSGVTSEVFDKAVNEAVSDLVRCKRVNGTFYVNLPLVYPDGSYVTVRLDQVEGGIRVSDAGFAFRQVEEVGAGRSFSRTAAKIAETFDVDTAKRAVFVVVDLEQLNRAIIDVAVASWTIADTICSKVHEEDEQLQEDLKVRLQKIFGPLKVRDEAKIIGVSANEWDVSAVVNSGKHDTVFQAVANHPSSIYKASTAFRDISGIKKPPKLVAVVRNKKELGQKISLLTPATVIEDVQSDEYFRMVAA